MSGRRRSLGALSRAFVNRLNHVLAGTVTQAPLTIVIDRDRANIRFRAGSGSSSIPFETKYGLMDLYIGQIGVLEVNTNSEEHFFQTIQYRYALLPERHLEPQIRWEYVRFPGRDIAYSRHHLQGPIPLNLSDDQDNRVTLNDVYLPTGWVPVEEVLRFCIVDLGVRPLNTDWNEILRESERLSRAEFSTMGEL